MSQVTWSQTLSSSFVSLADCPESGFSLLECPENPLSKGNLCADFLYPHPNLDPLKTSSYLADLLPYPSQMGLLSNLVCKD